MCANTVIALLTGRAYADMPWHEKGRPPGPGCRNVRPCVNRVLLIWEANLRMETKAANKT